MHGVRSQDATIKRLCLRQATGAMVLKCLLHRLVR
jgi:hypothetical protein